MARVLDEWLTLDSHARSGTDALVAPSVEIEGIGETSAEKLREAGVITVFDLWNASVVQLSNRTGISPTTLARWQQMADLMRIDGIGAQSAEVLVAAGVRTTRELAGMEVDDVATKLSKLLDRRPNMIGRPPTKKAIKGWILAALTMAHPGAPLDIEITDTVKERGWPWP